MEGAVAGREGTFNGPGRASGKGGDDRRRHSTRTEDFGPLGRSRQRPAAKVLHLFRFVPSTVKRRGAEMRPIINGGEEPRKPDPALLKAFARARRWFEELSSGRVCSLVEIARREGLAKRYVTRLTKLAFVSPTFVEAIAEGEVPYGANLQMLMDGRIALPTSWDSQEPFFCGQK